MFTEERAILATMNFNSEESREKLRELIGQLAEKMHARGDPWLLKGSTAREDSWYNRHLRKMKEEKKEKKESVVKKETMECVGVKNGHVKDVMDKNDKEVKNKNDKEVKNKNDKEVENKDTNPIIHDQSIKS